MDHDHNSNTTLDAAQKPSEKDHAATKETCPAQSDHDSGRETSSQPQYDSFMRIIRR